MVNYKDDTNDKAISFIPKETKPFYTEYDCPISDQINVKKYNVIIDSDIENDQVYLNLGYDHNEQYDCSFFLNSMDAFELADKLLNYACISMNKYRILERSKEWINTLKIYLQSHSIDFLMIKCQRLYTDDPEDTLFGTLVLKIGYHLKSSSDDTYKSAYIVSDNIRDKKEIYFEEVKNKLQELEIDTLDIDTEGFKFLYKAMQKKLDKWIDKNKDNSNQQEIPTMLPNNLKDSVQEVANRVIEKLNNQNK